MADSRHPAARRAQFADVSPDRPRKKPRWLSPRESSMPPPPAPAPSQPRASDFGHPSLRPAPVPKEFVQAVRRELRSMPSTSHELARGLAESETLAEQMARSLRPSEAPMAPMPPLPGGLHHEARAAVDPAIEKAFRGALEEIAATRARILEAAGGQLATLATIIARRVIARELTVAPDIIEDLVREGLEALSDQDKIRVRVGRGFRAAVDGLERQLAIRGTEFRIFVEDTLGDYDCIVETELGQVDESVEARLEKLLEALKPDSEAP